MTFKPKKSKFGYTITTRPHSCGTAYDLYYKWPRADKRHGVKGVRHRPLLGFNLTEDEAHRRALEMIQTIHRNVPGAPSTGACGHTMADILPIYWQMMQLKNRVEFDRPRSILECHLLPFFGRTDLRDITAAQGLDYVAYRQTAGASKGTIMLELQLLNRLLNLAVDYEKLPRNRLRMFFRNVSMPERRTRVVTQAELGAIRRQAMPDLWRLIVLALHTGLRLSKLLSIEGNWLSIADDGWWLMLPSARTPVKNNPPKLPLNQLAVDALRPDVGVFEKGKAFSRWKDKNSLSLWGRTMKRTGIEDLHFHDLRHTFATWLQNVGVGYEVRSALLGHRLKGMTADYSHGGLGWDACLRQAVTSLEMSYGVSYGCYVKSKNDSKSLNLLVSKVDCYG